MFHLDRKSPASLGAQIEQQLVEHLRDGRYAPGVRLPSIRALAGQLEVSPNTVVVVYDRLVAQGLLDAKGRSGYFARRIPGQAEDTQAALESGLEPDAAWLVQQANTPPRDVVQASVASLPHSWLADSVPVAHLQRAFAQLPGGMATRCPPQGSEALRERLAALLRVRGIAADTSRVLTSAGATEAIDLICRAFLRAGDSVVVEDPGYHLLAARLERLRVRMVLVPRGPEGIDTERLESVLAAEKPRMMFVQTALHNPTGWTAPASNLYRVLALAERHDTLLVEDDVWGHLLSGPSTTLAQLGGLSRVIYCSSFCKVLAPALRIGYIAADPHLLQPLLREKLYACLYGSALTEAVMTELLAAGRVRKLLDRLQQRLAQARQACLLSLRNAGVVFDSPAAAGLFLWGRLPHDLLFGDVEAGAMSRGLQLAGGRTFGSDPSSLRSVRWNVVHAQHVRVAEWLGQLG